MKKKAEQPNELNLQKTIQIGQQLDIISQNIQAANLLVKQKNPQPSQEQRNVSAQQIRETRALLNSVTQEMRTLKQNVNRPTLLIKKDITRIEGRIELVSRQLSRIEVKIRTKDQINQVLIQKKAAAQFVEQKIIEKPLKQVVPPVQRIISRPPSPKPRPVSAVVEDLGLQELGAGSYNTAYRSGNSQGDLVFKLIKNKEDKTDLPERSVRVWNQVNPGLQPPARLATCIVPVRDKQGKIRRVASKGWICPFVQGVQASDKEIHGKLLDVFNTTGRIVTDAIAPKNFVKTPTGDIVCVDIGLALELDKREKTLLVGLSRKPSLTSFETWKSDWTMHVKWLSDWQKTYPQTVTTVKALLFIKINRPDITNTDFLKQSPQSITELAAAYDEVCKKQQEQSKIDTAMATLEQVQSSEPEIIKDECRKILKEYLMYYGGTLNAQEAFVPYPATLRSTSPEEIQERTAHLSQVVSLIRQINTAPTREACFKVINDALSENMQRSRSVSPNLDHGNEQENLQEVLETIQEQGKSLHDLDALKQNCQKILNHYLASIGAGPSAPQTTSTTSTDQAYFKLKMVMHKFDDKILALINQIDTAESLEDIAGCITQFEQKLPLISPGKRAPSSPSSPIDDLTASISKCKVMVEAAKTAAQLTNTHTEPYHVK